MRIERAHLAVRIEDTIVGREPPSGRIRRVGIIPKTDDMRETYAKTVKRLNGGKTLDLPMFLASV